jgi:hypothetical protein
MLQETLVTADFINYISNFHIDFLSSHIPSFDPSIEGLNGRPKGGLSIFWNKKFDKFISPVIYSDNIMGLKLKVGKISYLLINMYTCHVMIVKLLP